ncbi:epididymal protein 13 isoform X2 [Canis aureus]
MARDPSPAHLSSVQNQMQRLQHVTEFWISVPNCPPPPTVDSTAQPVPDPQHLILCLVFYLWLHLHDPTILYHVCNLGRHHADSSSGRAAVRNPRYDDQVVNGWSWTSLNGCSSCYNSIFMTRTLKHRAVGQIRRRKTANSFSPVYEKAARRGEASREAFPSHHPQETTKQVDQMEHVEMHLHDGHLLIRVLQQRRLVLLPPL